MLKVKIWVKEDGDFRQVELRYLKPRNYMCSWDFDRALKYISKELYWNDIKKHQVEVIEFHNEAQQWYQAIKREA